MSYSQSDVCVDPYNPKYCMFVCVYIYTVCVGEINIKLNGKMKNWRMPLEYLPFLKSR